MPTPRETFRSGRLYVAGIEVAADDPAVLRHPHLFDGVEQATAAPGEKRDVAPPSAKVTCDVDGCDYEGTSRGLSIHTGRSHGDV